MFADDLAGLAKAGTSTWDGALGAMGNMSRRRFRELSTPETGTEEMHAVTRQGEERQASRVAAKRLKGCNGGGNRERTGRSNSLSKWPESRSPDQRQSTSLPNAQSRACWLADVLIAGSRFSANFISLGCRVWSTIYGEGGRPQPSVANLRSRPRTRRSDEKGRRQSSAMRQRSWCVRLQGQAPSV